MAADEASFSVLGLHCPSCALRLEKLLGAAPGVAYARVDFLRATAVVRAHPAASSLFASEFLALVTLAEGAGFRLARVAAV